MALKSSYREKKKDWISLQNCCFVKRNMFDQRRRCRRIVCEYIWFVVLHLFKTFNNGRTCQKTESDFEQCTTNK